MTAVMRGVRILEVAEHTFTPLAAGILSDCGATVIKIEHGDEILARELGLDDEAIIALKVAGVVA